MMNSRLVYPIRKVRINLLAIRDRRGLYEMLCLVRKECLARRGNQE
jgi:hypothetical protein